MAGRRKRITPKTPAQQSGFYFARSVTFSKQESYKGYHSHTQTNKHSIHNKMDKLFNTSVASAVKSRVWQWEELNATEAALKEAGVDYELALFIGKGQSDDENEELDEANFTRENGELIDETSDESAATYVGLILHLLPGCGMAPANIPTGYSFDIAQTERGGIYGHPAFFYSLNV